MRVLITGAAGFIGSHLADRLVADGHYVVGVDNLLTGRLDNFPRGKAAFYACDIVDRQKFYRVANLAKPDLVVHCAASYSDPNLWHRDTDTNVAGTINATLAAQHHNARLFYFQTALPPISSYAISKIAGEHYIEISGVPYVVFRLANMYGPRNVSGPIPTFYKRLTQGQPCTVVDTRRDMVYIDDLVEGVMRALADETVGGRFDMCSGEHLPVADLFSSVAAALGVTAAARHIPAGADDVKQMKLDPAPTREAIGWKPTTPLDAGVAAAVAWYREHGVDTTYTHLRLQEKAA